MPPESMGSPEGSWIRRHNHLKPAHTRSDRCSAADPWRLSPRIQMHDIYSWLVRRYDDSHQMLESARSWRFFGWLRIPRDGGHDSMLMADSVPA